MTELQAHAVIIGAGISGLVAAVRLAELGITPLVLEMGEAEKYPCNTRIAGGAFHVAHQDVAADPAVLKRAISARTGDDADAALIDALAADVGPAVNWLKAQGVRFIRAGKESYRQHTLAPPIAISGRNYWEGRGGDVLLRTLEAALGRHGVRIMRGVRAKRLLLEDGACVGLTAQRCEETMQVATSHVVVCDGGFHSDMALLREFVSPAPEKLKQRNARTGLGDGVRMVREAGGMLTQMHRFYGHVLAREAMDNDDLSPFPMLDFVCAAGIVVDASGTRFLDEGLGGLTMANRIAAQSDPLGAVAIFDAEIWEREGREYYIPANPQLITRGGQLFTAGSIGDLARGLELPPQALERTIGAYNAAVEGGQTATLTPPRTTSNYTARPLRTAPFHAVRLCAGITYTMGGIAIDAFGRVRDTHDAPIPGLYAAGCAAGGLEGGGERAQVAYLGGLARSTVSGWRAANHIAQRARSTGVAS